MNIVEEFAAAFNRQDVDALMACFTTGATYRDALYGDHAGTESLRGMFERMFREGRDFAWAMDTIVATPRRAAAEWTFSYVVTEAVPSQRWPEDPLAGNEPLRAGRRPDRRLPGVCRHGCGHASARPHPGV